MSKTSQTNGDQATRAYVAAEIADMLELSMQAIEKAGLAGQLHDVLCTIETARQKIAATKLEPETFEARGHTWTRHTPGDPCPVPEGAMVHVLWRCEMEGSEIGFASGRPTDWIWSKIDRGSDAEVVGWRYAEKPPPEVKVGERAESRLKLASVTIEPSHAQRVDLEPLQMDEPPAWPVLAPQLVVHPITAERDEVRSERDQLSRDLSSLLTKDCLDGHDAVEGRSNGIALRAAVLSMQAAIESAYVELAYAAGLSAVSVMKNNIAAGMSALRPFVRSNDPQKPTAEREEVMINKPLLAALRALVEPSKELVGLPLIGDLATRNSAVYAKWKAVQAALVNIKEQARRAGENPAAVNNHA